MVWGSTRRFICRVHRLTDFSKRPSICWPSHGDLRGIRFVVQLTEGLATFGPLPPVQPGLNACKLVTVRLSRDTRDTLVGRFRGNAGWSPQELFYELFIGNEITLPLNVARRAYSDSSRVFYCLECESEWRFDPVSGAWGTKRFIIDFVI